MQSLEIKWNHVLGSGGEGTVYLGVLNGATKCAVKIPHGHEHVANVPALRAQLLAPLRRERDRVQQAQGKRLIRLLGWNFDEPVPFLVYELAAHGSLADELTAYHGRDELMLVGDVLTRFEQVIAGIAELHRNGLIHRDLKPQNVLRMDPSTWKLADLGLGRSLERPCDLQTKAFAGTPAYAAPEQIERECFSQGADVFAAGGILWALLTNTPPPRTRPLPKLRSARGDVPAELERLVQRMLANDPALRPRSANDVVSQLSGIRFAHTLAEIQRTTPKCVRCGRPCTTGACSRCGEIHCH